MAPRSQQYVSIESAAETLGVEPRSIRRWIAEGIIPAYRVGKRVIRIPAAAVEAALQPIPTAGGGRG